MVPAERSWIHVRGLRLWAHVGVLPVEREHGQWFELELRLGLALDGPSAASSDDLAHTLDYCLVIQALQTQARTLVCHTIEHYSAQVLDLVQALYGPVPIQLDLRKCQVPVAGFGGDVAIQMRRHWPQDGPWPSASQGPTAEP
jgi:dihydroneopterin aldolase